MPETVTVAAEAMATRFEVALHGAAEATLRAAAEEARCGDALGLAPGHEGPPRLSSRRTLL